METTCPCKLMEEMKRIDELTERLIKYIADNDKALEKTPHARYAMEVQRDAMRIYSLAMLRRIEVGMN